MHEHIRGLIDGSMRWQSMDWLELGSELTPLAAGDSE